MFIQPYWPCFENKRNEVVRVMRSSSFNWDFAGYKFDEHERESANLRLQFARFPGPRSGGGPRGRR